MAIIIPEKKLLFLHIPKNGGTYISKILGENFEWRSIGVKHTNAILESSIINAINAGYFTFAFVRHPIEWYRSYWSFQMGVNPKQWTLWESEAKWHPTRIIDQSCGSNNFNIFVENILDKYPNFLYEMYKSYIYSIDNKKIDYIGKYENLYHDLLDIFSINNISNLNIDKNSINISHTYWKNLAKYSEKLFYKVIDYNKNIINEFNYSNNISDFIEIIE